MYKGYQISYEFGGSIKYGALQIVSDTTIKVASDVSLGMMKIYGVMHK